MRGKIFVLDRDVNRSGRIDIDDLEWDYLQGDGDFRSDEVTPGLEWVLAGEGLATVKIDGTCCAVIGGKFYKRYDAKKGKTPPPGAIPCCDPDPVTGHWPHWLLVDPADQGSNWHLAAYYNAGGTWLSDGTYEAIGPHFQSNPYALTYD